MQNLRQESRFIKSYKYKHKPKLRPRPTPDIETKTMPTSCDTSPDAGPLPSPNADLGGSSSGGQCCPPLGSTRQRRGKSKLAVRVGGGGGCWAVPERRWPLWCLLLLLLNATQSAAFCPSKCHCDDQLLSANCTQVPSITIIPMTFNPMLKQLTLNHLPMGELSNSLSVYRHLEYLNLNSNQLRQIKYQNFNFKPAPPSVLLAPSHLQQPPPPSSQSQFSAADGAKSLPSNALHLETSNLNNELMAKHLRQAIDKSLSQVVGANSEDEIGFHLRDLDLGDNRIELLGSLPELEDDDGSGEDGSSSSEPTKTSSGGGGGNMRLRATELERLAPFLSLTRLENLNLSGNRLIRLQPHTFLGLINLKRLDLSRNQLDYIDRHAFVGLIELSLLKLDHNRLGGQLQTLSWSFCRAPMMELRFLDLSNNQHHKSRIVSGQPQSPPSEPAEALLPNQMFICAPRLVSLRLDSLRLRYIQVNAFDNLQQLETLNLSHNHLDQVPSEALAYSSSNLSLSLRQLDLSDNLIEFVNARSFGGLRNLQKLCMNSMQRLLSFDLASLAVRNLLATSFIGQQQLDRFWPETINTQPPQASDMANLEAYANLVNASAPEVVASNPTASAGPTINHAAPTQLINDQLIELQLKHNPRLQSLHSSLAHRQEPPRGRIRFARLRLLDLQGALELRDFALDQMIDLTPSPPPPTSGADVDQLMVAQQGPDRLRLDLSLVAKLNCSSCQMSWLVEAARHQLRHPRQAMEEALDEQQAFTQAIPPPRVLLQTGNIGCSWPFAVGLLQLIELETSYAPIFNHHCHPPPVEQQRQALDATSGPDRQLNRELALGEPARPSATSEPGSVAGLAAALVLVLVLFGAGAKLAWLLLLGPGGGHGRSSGFKWRSPSLGAASSSMDSPGSSAHSAHQPAHSPADCSSSSILSSSAAAAAAFGSSQLYGKRPTAHLYDNLQAQVSHQAAAAAEAQHRLLNYGQLNGQLLIFGGNNAVGAASGRALADGGRSARGSQIARALRRGRGNLFSRIAGRLSATSWRQQQQQPPLDLSRELAAAKRSGAIIIENVVYGGDDRGGDKILARDGGTFAPLLAPFSGKVAATQLGPSDHSPADGHHSRRRPGPPDAGSPTDFIKPAYCQSSVDHFASARDAGGPEGPISVGQLPVEAELVTCYANCGEQQEAARRAMEEPTSYQMLLLLKQRQLQAMDRVGRTGEPPQAGRSPITCHSSQQQGWRSQQQQLEPSTSANPPMGAAYLSQVRQASPLQQRESLSPECAGHIYVTLDGPIKQQNGQSVEYHPPQPTTRLTPQNEAQPSRREACFGPEAQLDGSEPEHKSFEWSREFCAEPEAAAAPQHWPDQPLEMEDKFKLAPTRPDLGRGPLNVGQLGGKLSSGERQTELENIRQQQQPITATYHPEDAQHFGRKSSGRDELARSGPPRAMQDTRNGNPGPAGANTDSPGRNRKSKRPRRARAADVTGHTDYHVDDDDDDVVGDGRRSGLGSGELGARVRPRQQLFMGLTSGAGMAAAAAATTNEPKWADGSLMDGSDVTTLAHADAAAAAAATLAGGGGCGGSGRSKYDANHGPRPAAASETARRAPSDKSPGQNCVINGLQSQQQQQSQQIQPLRQLGVTGTSLSSSSKRGQQSNNNNAISNNNQTNPVQAGASESPLAALMGQRDFVASDSADQAGYSSPSPAGRARNGLAGVSTTDSDYRLYGDGRTQLCDISQENSVAITGPAALPPTAATSHVSGASNNEIYTNQFYYCRPSAATLARIRTSEAAAARRADK